MTRLRFFKISSASLIVTSLTVLTSFTLLAALVALATLTACGGGNDVSPPPSQAPASGAPASGASASGAPATSTKVDYAAGAARPLSVTPTLDPAAVQEIDVPLAGATLVVTGGNGTRYTLVVPANALRSPTRIRMQAVSALAGLPPGIAAVHGVQLEPGGLHFINPATFTIEAAAPVPLAQQAFCSYDLAGDDMHPMPSELGAAASLAVWHFSGYGMAALARERNVSRVFADVVPAGLEARRGAALAAAGRSCANAITTVTAELALNRQRQLLGLEGDAEIAHTETSSRFNCSGTGCGCYVVRSTRPDTALVRRAMPHFLPMQGIDIWARGRPVAQTGSFRVEFDPQSPGENVDAMVDLEPPLGIVNANTAAGLPPTNETFWAGFYSLVNQNDTGPGGYLWAADWTQPTTRRSSSAPRHLRSTTRLRTSSPSRGRSSFTSRYDLSHLELS